MKVLQWKHSLAGYLALFPILAACGGFENASEFDTSPELVEVEVNQSALLTPTPEPTTDTLTAYAAKCELATGIRIPDFSCNSGLSGAADPNGPNEPNFAVVSQITSVDNIESNQAIGGASGTRLYVNGDQLKSQIQAPTGDFDGTSDAFYFSHVAYRREAKAEVKISSLTSSGASALAGLMYRTTALDVANPNEPFPANAQNFMLGVAPNPACTGCVKIVWQQRPDVQENVDENTAVDATLLQLGGSNVTLPVWLRVSVSGNGMAVAQASRDHNTWTTVGNPLPAMLYYNVGLAVASATATFENFSTTKKCDTPNVLAGFCEPDSTFQVLARTSDAIAVANCRKGTKVDPDIYSDIAIIQYNRTNGAICFYQSPTGDDTNGKAITAPSKGNGAGMFPWGEPAVTHAGGCTGCHDNGGLIRSPYLTQTGLLPKFGEGYDNDGLNALRYVGLDFANDRSWSVSLTNGDSCSSCHSMAMNNVEQAGTAYKFAVMATSRYQTAKGYEADQEALDSHKNDVSATSPRWMPYEGDDLTTWPYDESGFNWNPYLEDARELQACAKLGWGEDIFDPSPTPAASQQAGFAQPLTVGGCFFSLRGQSYGTWIDTLNEYEIKTGAESTGSATGNVAAVSITAAAKTDVYDLADNHYWLYKNQGGDGSAIVRVKSLTGGNEFAKAGIMFRNGYATNATNVMVALTKSHGATFQYRAAPGDLTQTAYLDSAVSVNPATQSTWLRLDRSGRTFVGFISTNNRETWTQIAPPVTLPGLVTDFLGLVATSNKDSTVTSTSEFESFDWADRGGWTGLYNAHVLVDAKIAADPVAIKTITSTRKEWITRETITAKSGDISGNTDSFSYSFKTFGGPGHMETTVSSLTGSSLNEWTKAGLMIRDNANANAMNVFVGRTRDGVTFQGRSATGGTTTAFNIPLSGTIGPVSFRLRRDNNANNQSVFSAAYMLPGGEWIAWPAAQTFTYAAFSNSPLSGLAVSTNGGPDATAVFNSGALVEPPGLIWTSYDQAANNSWLQANVATAAASRFVNNTVKTLSAAGAGILGTSDQFLYTFQDLPGAATIQARVTLQGDLNSNPLAKAGLMFRSKAGPTSRNVMLALTKGFGANLQYRSTDGGNTTASGYAGTGTTMWLKLVRTPSNQFMGYTSTDGVSWTLVSSTTLSTMSSIAMVGFAVSSHDVNNPITATFSDISVTLQPAAQGPCASYCQNPTTFTFGNTYQSGNLGTGAKCMQTTRPIVGGNCGNFINGRTLSVNGVARTCNNQNWAPPAPVNGGYCVQVTPGNQSFAYFSLFN